MPRPPRSPWTDPAGVHVHLCPCSLCGFYLTKNRISLAVQRSLMSRLKLWYYQVEKCPCVNDVGRLSF